MNGVGLMRVIQTWLAAASEKPKARAVIARGRRRNVWRAVLWCALCVCIGVQSSRAQNGQIEIQRRDFDRELRLSTSSGKLIQLQGGAGTMFIADPSIADIQLPSPDRVFIYGKKPGRTTFYALRQDGTQAETFTIIVTHNLADLNRLLRSQIDELKIQFVDTPQGLVIGGVVPTAEVAERVKTIANKLAGEGNTVISSLRVSGSMQVSIRVRIAEISRSVIKQLGVNWAAVGKSGAFTFGLASGSLSTAVNSSLQSAAAGGSIAKGANITTLVDALATQGLASILAEPTLTAVSGEKASFLAGGEFPVPVAQSATNNISVDYRKYGVSLDFTPVVISDRIISLNVKPEVSDISANGAVVMNNIQIPAITTRRAETTVQLGSGESLVLAGLIQNRFSTDVDKLPGLGDIPILGTLFRSSSFQKNESELIIIVTPYLVRPASSPNAFRLPTDSVEPSGDVDRILEGRLANSRTPAGSKPPVKLRGDPGFIYK
ncbi:type II and III secretion system protein family protein [Rhodomicrobium udaipurense]|uniref:Type II and III secretion system protein family protein n=1 Tax=Rhodomicrobium udaipurense TaxID=1202716 RepID=A0A8I1GED3_9HYPH|nr:type II and III secretion system protein family protein [Rhodomicrobium udaipurense]MBJ7544440.1 type II and III secretion system protein family protein [Rhodomicrobium udaipurense]